MMPQPHFGATFTLGQKCLAEFLGTFFLVLTIGCNVLTDKSPFVGFSIATCLMVFIYALGGISGANFNPAVSLALFFSKAMKGPGMGIGDVCVYIVSQLAGGICAAYTFCYLLDDHETVAVGPSGDFTIMIAGVCEMIYTFMLTFVVLNVAAAESTKPNQYFGIAIGFVIVAGAYGAGAVSGGCFNPAVAIGLGVSSGSEPMNYLIYTGFELLGALLGAGFFRAVRVEEFGGKATLVQKLISEFLGTFMLVVTVSLNVLGKSPAGALSIACGLTSMIFALGSVSGANFNPAVSTAILVARQLPVADYFAYIATQVVAGICATSVCTLIIYPEGGLSLGPGKGYELNQALVAEFLFTFVLCFVVLSVAVSELRGKDHGTITKQTNLFGLCIGGCIIIGGFAVGGISGGSFNPAVSYGLGLTSPKYCPINATYYSLVELVAGACAAGVYLLIQNQPTSGYGPMAVSG